ncbi:hypothetical protein Ahy_A07g033551 [Arachis hypogaea]|uniref:Uncharacterized protein n=1 Tax=Arachis hypogaea TaxID=3818 RepID=A0A445C9H8_ARAHY|nr:hypothetical protein Ahy_A07g033551 [Arachis hypogaea]
MHVTQFDRTLQVFSVEELEPLEKWSQISYRVRLNSRTTVACVQSLHFPYCLAITSCIAASIEWGRYVNPVYRMESVFKVYEVDRCRLQMRSCG